MCKVFFVIFEIQSFGVIRVKCKKWPVLPEMTVAEFADIVSSGHSLSCSAFYFDLEMVFVDQLVDVVIAGLSVAAAIAVCILLLVNVCIKHQRPVLSLVAILLTFVSGKY